MLFDWWRLSIRTRVTPDVRQEVGHHQRHPSPRQVRYGIKPEREVPCPARAFKTESNPSRLPACKPNTLTTTRSVSRPRIVHPSHRSLCMHIITYGQKYDRIPHVKGTDTIVQVDCTRLVPPPPNICKIKTGLDIEVASDFFSRRANQAVFEDKLHEIEEFLDANPKREGCVAVLVSCHYGVHRSVVMAERLAIEVKRRNGIKVECKHLDLGKGIEKMQRAAEGRKRLDDATRRGRAVRWARGT